MPLLYQRGNENKNTANGKWGRQQETLFEFKRSIRQRFGFGKMTLESSDSDGDLAIKCASLNPETRLFQVRPFVS
jgi:hypothetical protein